MKSQPRLNTLLLVPMAGLMLFCARAHADPDYNRPPEDCATNWCQFVVSDCLTPASQVLTNIYTLPSTQFCLGTTFYAEAHLASLPGTARVRDVWSPPGPNCPTIVSTNTYLPASQTNWWEITGTDFYLSKAGLWVVFTPTNSGDYTLVFHDTWTNAPPCGYGVSCPGGSTAITNTFTVLPGGGGQTTITLASWDGDGLSATNGLLVYTPLK